MSARELETVARERGLAAAGMVQRTRCLQLVGPPPKPDSLDAIVKGSEYPSGTLALEG